ncbi:hypothetical protein, partial [Pantoea sp.]|uniref:hypothetical protein n=1 Tax=Pantoea sp. TaxID=69393 RepID=UPI0028A224D0
KGADCKSAVTDFEGSNPSPTTILYALRLFRTPSPRLSLSRKNAVQFYSAPAASLPALPDDFSQKSGYHPAILY